MRSIYQRIGAQIRVFRKKAGITQEEIAEKAGITPEHFNRIERARQDPSIKTLCRIAEILDTDVCSFFIPEVSEEILDVTSVPLRELIQLLSGRSKKEIKLILDLSKRICTELDSSKGAKSKKAL